MRYDYHCGGCNKIIEVSHGMSETPKIVCEKCGKDMEKVITGGQGFIFRNGDDSYLPKRNRGIPTREELMP